jgi:pyruvate/2-oxoglutarate dehydrogenase complex dihydrolipoamide dehydrogenase (E3) component
MFNIEDKYDILVIGGGIAGLTAAKTAATAKKKVAIIEQGQLGGEYVYEYDVPSEVGLNAVRAMSALESIQRFGAKKRTISLSLAGLDRARKEAVKSVEGLWGEEAIKREGIDVIKGRAKFTEAGIEVLNGKERRYLTANRYIIATGSKQDLSKIKIDTKVKYWTAREFWATTRMPKTLLIVGAGMSGMEMAYYATKLGSRVVLVEHGDRLLPQEDEEVGRFYGASFAKLGRVNTVLGAEVESISEKELVLRRGGTRRKLPITASAVVVMATGERPNIDGLGLDEVGVRVREGRIQVDRSLMTTNRRIYAAGTCVDEVPSDLAMLMGKTAVLSIVSRNAPIMSGASSPRTLRLAPSYARIGVTETELLQKKIRYRKSVVLLSEIPKGRTVSAEGFVCLLADTKMRIIGAKIIAPEAESMILALAAAIKYQMTVDELLKVPVPLDSWNEAIRLALTRL